MTDVLHIFAVVMLGISLALMIYTFIDRFHDIKYIEEGTISLFRMPSGDVVDIDGNLRQHPPTECPVCHKPLEMDAWWSLGSIQYRSLRCRRRNHTYVFRLPPLENGKERIHDYHPRFLPLEPVKMHGPNPRW